MIALKVFNDEEIDVSNIDFRNKVIQSISNYVNKNFDNIINIEKEYFDNEKYPYVATISVKL